MDLNGNSFGYDYFKPTEYYSLKPEDLNPSLRLNYRQKINDYYSEPPMRRVRTGSRSFSDCSCNKKHGIVNNTTLYILIICLIVITVIQWFIIFFANSSPSSVTINNITSHDKFIDPTEEKKEEKSDKKEETE